jgi:hypothetical protein
MFFMAKAPALAGLIAQARRFWGSKRDGTAAATNRCLSGVAENRPRVQPSGRITPMDESTKNGSFQADRADAGRDEQGRHDKSNAKREQAETRKEKLDEALDVALEESFPASDPISIAQPPQSVYDKHDRQKR